MSPTDPLQVENELRGRSGLDLDPFVSIALRSTSPERSGHEGQAVLEVLHGRNRGLPSLPVGVMVERAGASDQGSNGAGGRMDTLEDFRQRLGEVQAKYAPFLDERCPLAPVGRRRESLVEFDFRKMPSGGVETDRAVPAAAKWDRVRVPHFCGPANRWSGEYRRHFATPGFQRGERVWLVFRGVDYRCEVAVNGRAVGRHEGFFATFEFDVTDQLVGVAGQENLLEVRIFNDAVMGGGEWAGAGSDGTDGDKIYAATGLGWDEPGSGWAHCPPGAGIYQPVYLEVRPEVFIKDAFVRAGPGGGEVDLWLEIENSRLTYCPVRARVGIFPRNFDGSCVKSVELELDPAGPGYNEYRATVLAGDLRTWTGERPYLYVLRVTLLDESSVARDCFDRSFGARSFTQDETLPVRGTLRLNGEQVILRGANTMGHEQRAIFDGRPEQVIEDVLIAKLANLNFLRLTQRPVQSEIYDICDRLGMMVQTDLPVFGYVRKNQFEEVARQAGEMERHIRGHASAIMVSFINEASPAAWKPRRGHRNLDRATLNSLLRVCAEVVKRYNPDRVIKPIDGDYEPPGPYGMPDEHCYCGWYGDHGGVPIGKLHGGALMPLPDGWKAGCGEYGAEGLDAWDTMRTFYPAAWLPKAMSEGDMADWTPEHIHRAQTWAWGTHWFEPQQTVRRWVEASQAHQAWATRTMTDAFRRRSDVLVSTAVHLLIDAYPAGWLKSLVSVDRTPKRAFFELADSLTPLAVNVRTDRSAVFADEKIDVELWVLNDRPGRETGLRVVYEAKMGDEVLVRQEVPVEVGGCAPLCVGRVVFGCPLVVQRTSVVVSATLLKGGRRVHRHQVEVEIFPGVERVLEGVAVSVIGSAGGELRAGLQHRAGGRAHEVVRVFGGEVVPWSKSFQQGVWLIDSPGELRESRAMLAEHIEGGGTAVLLEHDTDEPWQIGPHQIGYTAEAKRHFAWPDREHPAMEGVGGRDIFWWHDAERGHVSHVTRRGLTGDGLRPLALIGTTCWGSPRKIVPVAGEIVLGKGLAVVSEVWAVDRLVGEPRAARYLAGILRHVSRFGVQRQEHGRRVVKRYIYDVI